MCFGKCSLWEAGFLCFPWRDCMVDLLCDCLDRRGKGACCPKSDRTLFLLFSWGPCVPLSQQISCASWRNGEFLLTVLHSYLWETVSIAEGLWSSDNLRFREINNLLLMVLFHVIKFYKLFWEQYHCHSVILTSLTEAFLCPSFTTISVIIMLQLFINIKLFLYMLWNICI